MTLLQIYSWSPESAKLAVRLGADELLLDASLTLEQLREIIEFSRPRGVRAILDYSYPVNDRTADKRAHTLGFAYMFGLDAVVTGDLGMLRIARSAAPDCEALWFCETSDELRFAQSQGCSGAVIPPHVTFNTISCLADSFAGFPLSILALAPLCPSSNRQHCLLDKKHGEFGCSYSCLEHFGYGSKADSRLMQTRDLCLLRHTPFGNKISSAVVISPVKTLPALRAVVRASRSALDGETPDEQQISKLFFAMGRPSPTDAPFTGHKGIFDPAHEPREPKGKFWSEERKKLVPEENIRIPVRFFALIERGVPAKLAVDDMNGNTLYVTGPVPTLSEGKGLIEAEANTQWFRGGSFYKCAEARTRLDPGISLSIQDMTLMRSRALAQLTAARTVPPKRAEGNYIVTAQLLPRADAPAITVRVTRLAQISPELLGEKPERIYIPLMEAAADLDKAGTLIESGTVPVAELPRHVPEGGRLSLNAALSALYNIGFREALAWSPGQFRVAEAAGFSVRAGWYSPNTQALKAAKSIGALSCVLAPWLTFSDIGEISHVMDTELIGYGRLELLLARECLIRPKSGLCACDNHNEISSARGGMLPLLPDGTHNTIVYDSRKLWLKDSAKLWKRLGLWAIRIDFTTENARECAAVIKSYKNAGPYVPQAYTQGFYIPEDPKR